MSIIPNNLGSERSVEIPFTVYAINKYSKEGNLILDVGGVPTNNDTYTPIILAAKETKANYKVSDFRGGDYHGDFVKYPFENTLFDIIMFISSLEHFPQCTESDKVYRDKEDIRGFKKALQILKFNGIIILTVPFGRHIWQPYHQNYNMDGIRELTSGSTIEESYVYKLKNNEWVLTDPSLMGDVIYDSKANGVGCFILRKN